MSSLGGDIPSDQSSKEDGSLTAEEIEAFSIILSSGSGTEAAAEFLIQQISTDLGVEVDIDIVTANMDNLDVVVSSFNTLVNSLNRAQLIRAYNSAPLQAILQALQAAAQVVEDDNEEDELASDTSAAILLLLKLL